MYKSQHEVNDTLTYQDMVQPVSVTVSDPPTGMSQVKHVPSHQCSTLLR